MKKKLFSAIPLLTGSILLAIGGMQSCTPSGNSKKDNDTAFECRDIVQWEGVYEAFTDAGRTAGGTFIGFNTRIVISTIVHFGDYCGVYEIEGYQTWERRLLYASVDRENPYNLNVWFPSVNGSYVVSEDDDEPLCTIHYDAKADKFSVKWACLDDDFYNEGTEFSKIATFNYLDE